MRRSSVGFIGCYWKRPSADWGLTYSRLVVRQMASGGSNKASIKGGGKFGSGTTVSSGSASGSGSGSRSTTTSSVSGKILGKGPSTSPRQSPSKSPSSESAKGFRIDLTGNRQLKREGNMWSDPKNLNTKWLQPCDPRRYKPDFGQTEPQSLRKQFMRSPDERTRDAMSRDWETAMRVAANKGRQIYLTKYRREQELQNQHELEQKTKETKRD